MAGKPPLLPACTQTCRVHECCRASIMPVTIPDEKHAALHSKHRWGGQAGADTLNASHRPVGLAQEGTRCSMLSGTSGGSTGRGGGSAATRAGPAIRTRCTACRRSGEDARSSCTQAQSERRRQGLDSAQFCDSAGGPVLTHVVVAAPWSLPVPPLLLLQKSQHRAALGRMALLLLEPA